MKTIRELYENLSDEKTIFFQCRTKYALKEILKEVNQVLVPIDRLYREQIEKMKLSQTWFILGNWRGGMFELKWEDDDIHICADYKESSIQFNNHLWQINKLIDIMDKHRKDFIHRQWVDYDEHFNIRKTSKSGTKGATEQ